jgi:ABC-2 type transport system ATP-binding protein
VANATPESLINRSRFHNAVTIRFGRAAEVDVISGEIKRLDEVDHVEVDDKHRSLTAFPASDTLILRPISDLCWQKSWPVEQLHLESGRLDEVFRSITAAETPT